MIFHALIAKFSQTDRYRYTQQVDTQRQQTHINSRHTQTAGRHTETADIDNRQTQTAGRHRRRQQADTHRHKDTQT